MDDYQAYWLPAAIALTALGVIISFLLWRRRGIGSGLRGLSWSLLPIALYLVGLLDLIIPFAVKVVNWALNLVFSLGSWLGLALLALSVVLWIVSGVIIGRRKAAAREAADDAGEATTKEPDTRKAVTEQQGTGTGAGQDADDFSDIEAMLKRRGIE